jgi:hypothetical protein
MVASYRTSTATCVATSLFLAAATAAAAAHGASTGAPHMGTTTATTLHAGTTAPAHSLTHRAATSSGIAPAPQSLMSTTLAPNVSSQCAGEVSANCEARAESDATVSNGDPNPVWSAPVPTSVPSTPSAAPINEPQAAATDEFEQSGGGSGVATTAGGGPTLTDCMALWEPAVHMTKQLWKNVCIRTMNGINEPRLALESVDPAYVPRKHATREARH